MLIGDEEFFAKARRAGAVFMAFAVETASPRLQKMIRKNIQLEKINRNIALARKEGIFCQGLFMLGFPSETREELLTTIDFAVRSQLHAAHLFMVNPFEVTELAELAKKMGKPVVNDFNNNYMTSGFVNLTDLSDKEVNRIRRWGLIRFWLKPSRVWAIIRSNHNCRTWSQFLSSVFYSKSEIVKTS
jgi:anaerobic magnesium-protoporphyrin IX monomethyl ester cyclase